MKIRTIVGVLLVLALVLGSTGVGAAEPKGPPSDVPHDDDGDGIRNCEDSDWEGPPLDGTGHKKQRGK
jgi:hypothetical protein